MRVYRNVTTRRLEAFASAKCQCECAIRIIEPHEEGRYFITRVNGEELRYPISLGWTDQHAIDGLKRRVWDHRLLGNF